METGPEAAREIPLGNLSAARLIQLEACTRCGECLNWCPVHDQDAREQIIPRKKITDFLHIVKTQHSLLTRIMKQEKVSDPIKKLLAAVFRYKEIGQDEVEEFVRNLYECSTCGQCQIVCPANIDTVKLWEEIRRLIVTAGYGPLEPQKVLVKSVKAYDNPWQQPRAGRTKWARRAHKDKAISAPPREIKERGQGPALSGLHGGLRRERQGDRRQHDQDAREPGHRLRLPGGRREVLRQRAAACRRCGVRTDCRRQHRELNRVGHSRRWSRAVRAASRRSGKTIPRWAS